MGKTRSGTSKTVTTKPDDRTKTRTIVVGATCAPYKLDDAAEHLAWLSERAAMEADAASAGFRLAWFVALEHHGANPSASPFGGLVDDEWGFSIDTGATRIDGYERLVRICTGRNLIVEYAMRRDADWILFLDTDVTPAPNSVSGLLALNWPIVGGEVPGYRLSGRRVKFISPVGRWGGVRYRFPVQAHWNTAGYLMVHRELYRKIRWRIDPPLTDDPCYAFDAVQLGFPTLVRKDVVGDHRPLVPIEERAYRLEIASAGVRTMGGNTAQASTPDPGERSTPEGPGQSWDTAPRANMTRSRDTGPRTGVLGIGVITMNRLDALKQCVARIARHTTSPYVLVIADDGSTDETVEWARGEGVPVVTGDRRGCAWNKNRALYFLRECTDCDPIILLEDDTWPVRDGWERVWIDAGHQWRHVNFDGSSYNADLAPEDRPTEPGTAIRPYATPHVTGVCTVTSRAALDSVGYLDTRFHGYGIEHVEWTERFAARFGTEWNLPDERYPALNHGVLMAWTGASSFDPDEVNANHQRYVELRSKTTRTGFRRPWRNDEEWLTLGLEVAIAWEMFAAETNDDRRAGSDRINVDGPAPARSLSEHLPRVLESLRYPNGPELWFFTDGESPHRALTAVYGIILNGYSPNGITLFGSHHWDDHARREFTALAPFATVAQSDLVFATIEQAMGRGLAAEARRRVEVERIAAPLVWPGGECCVAGDDVFVLNGVDDALRTAREHDLVIIADAETAPDPPKAGLFRSSRGLHKFPGSLYWVRRHVDSTRIAKVAALLSSDAAPWPDRVYAMVALLYAGRPTALLPADRYAAIAGQIAEERSRTGVEFIDACDVARRRGLAALVAGAASRAVDDGEWASLIDLVLGERSPMPTTGWNAANGRPLSFERHSAGRHADPNSRPGPGGGHSALASSADAAPIQVRIRGQQFLARPMPSVPNFWDEVNQGAWELDTFAVLDRLVSSGTTYVDCGAWIGPTVLFAASKGASVTAYECDPVALEALHRNIELNPEFASRIDIIDAALTDQDGPAVLHAFSPGDSQTTFFSSVERGGEVLEPGAMATVRGLDTGREFDRRGWLNDPHALVKIDTEGAEYRMLASLGSRIATAACSFYVSFHTINIVNIVGGGTRPDRLVRQQATLTWMDQFWDYAWWRATHGTTLEPIDKQHFLDLALAGEQLPSILFSRRKDLATGAS